MKIIKLEDKVHSNLAIFKAKNKLKTLNEAVKLLLEESVCKP